MSPEDVVTVAQIAEILRLNQQTVRNWIDQGSLPAMRVGRRVRVRWGGVEAMMEAGWARDPRAAARPGLRRMRRRSGTASTCRWRPYSTTPRLEATPLSLDPPSNALGSVRA